MQVFERVAKPVVLSALDGINGTVFAYGQARINTKYTSYDSLYTYSNYVDNFLPPFALPARFAPNARPTSVACAATSPARGGRAGDPFFFLTTAHHLTHLYIKITYP